MPRSVIFQRLDLLITVAQHRVENHRQGATGAPRVRHRVLIVRSAQRAAQALGRRMAKNQQNALPMGIVPAVKPDEVCPLGESQGFQQRFGT